MELWLVAVPCWSWRLYPLLGGGFTLKCSTAYIPFTSFSAMLEIIHWILHSFWTSCHSSFSALGCPLWLLCPEPRAWQFFALGHMLQLHHLGHVDPCYWCSSAHSWDVDGFKTILPLAPTFSVQRESGVMKNVQYDVSARKNARWCPSIGILQQKLVCVS